ncbi:MAG TPA: FtsX-like permease family protein, partial [Cyclobacteriaceae bacterium]|nr:FtsX-like permease family protein [Cyclobacteriaceae bacterium]
LFPAGVLSGFQPINVLKNMSNTKLMSRVGLRKALLVVQFSLSMIFILTVMVLYNQVNLFLHHDNGFSAENKLIVQKGNTSFDILKPELEKHTNIRSVSAASHIPMAGVVRGTDMKRVDAADWSSLTYYAVDADYLKNMNLTLVAGKFFVPEAGASNENYIILNEEAVKWYQFESAADAIGETLILQSDSTEKIIMGVVKNYYHELFSDRLKPLGLFYSPNEFSILQIQYTGSLADAEETVKKVSAGVNPGLHVEVKDFEKEMGLMYDILFGTLLKVLGFVSGLAITISCLGLLGMATYTIETRKKEIAVRKILGGSNQSLIYILSKGYLTVLVMAMTISIPVAYWMNTLWLEMFAVHVTVDVFTISASVLILGFFGLFTIGSQTLQAAYLNPVDNLKDE